MAAALLKKLQSTGRPAVALASASVDEAEGACRAAGLGAAAALGAAHPHASLEAVAKSAGALAARAEALTHHADVVDEEIGADEPVGGGETPTASPPPSPPLAHGLAPTVVSSKVRAEGPPERPIVVRIMAASEAATQARRP